MMNLHVMVHAQNCCYYLTFMLYIGIGYYSYYIYRTVVITSLYAIG